ncbi:restriction endonuclease subunit S [Burkholderia cenocepacia]|uniref:restriction endonuclease subunit S n=1 Tax=Burkholderia cenocepacia TaxID=95486 RepID=UPI001B9DBEF2|nr:restriction endonuclease subunit S [Burkholderia cenocepacia]MBR8200106.1 restriction endonuclease subunit S [Burkholderia cenocepacia]MBR8296255.1 restriction endonuclease subunit S [Burkholderia cenocepacia]MBR8415353.1 restriction endonuclease subunit S [Burkholderia cenocepacia]HDV6330097.1 restriction endonuclease subunit S [Burkholderia cenocepacia]HDV6356239.1 restriction endonuclease subunit S [Burkholderia cenocepacia]
MPTARFPEQRLKYAATINDEALSESTDADSELAYIDIGNVDSQGRVHDIVNYRFEDAPSRARRIVRDGDVIISTVRTYLQAIAPVENPPDNLIVSTGFAVVRPSNLLDHQFCKYALRANRFLWEVESRSTGVSYPAINASDLGDIKVSLPEIGAQRTIANYLDRETARINGLIAEKERMLALLEEKRAALISRVVTRGLTPNAPLKPSGQEWLGEIPAHWGVQRLKQLAEVRGGLTLGKQYSGELLEYPYLRVANVQDGYLKLDDVSTVEVPASEAASNLLAYGDVLMNEGGDIDKLGRGCVWRDEIAPCLHQNHVFAVRPHSVDSDWLALWTSTLQAKRYFESRAKRSTNLASISGSNIKELPVPLPPVSEQLAIQQFLIVRNTRLETLRGELRDSLRLLTERRSALITAAVTGQIPLEEMTE